MPTPRALQTPIVGYTALDTDSVGVTLYCLYAYT